MPTLKNHLPRTQINPSPRHAIVYSKLKQERLRRSRCQLLNPPSADPTHKQGIRCERTQSTMFCVFLHTLILRNSCFGSPDEVRLCVPIRIVFVFDTQLLFYRNTTIDFTSSLLCLSTCVWYLFFTKYGLVLSVYCFF